MLLAPVHAAVLDWNTLTNNGTANLPSLPNDSGDGTISTTYTNVGGSGVNVTISFRAFDPGGSTIDVDTVADYTFRTTPISGDTEGGGIRIQYDADGDEPYVRTTITFSQPVNNLQFEIWDVDRASWRDEIRNITGITTGNATFNPASITPRSTNTVGMSTTSNSVTADENPNPNNPATNDGGADVVINFGTTSTNSIRFDYGNNPTGVGNPQAQLIWISGLTFDPIPEPSVVLGGVLLLLGIGVVEWRRRRRPVGP